MTRKRRGAFAVRLQLFSLRSSLVPWRSPFVGFAPTPPPLAKLMRGGRGRKERGGWLCCLTLIHPRGKLVGSAQGNKGTRDKGNSLISEFQCATGEVDIGGDIYYNGEVPLCSNRPRAGVPGG